jgi:hypothetical protein
MEQELLSQLFEHYVAEVKKLSSIDNFYDYEKKFSELHTTLGKQVLEQSLANVGDSRKKKY